MDKYRIGIGFDVHPLVEGRDLIIGGEKIDYPFGLMGHSDADVLLHAIIDSLLGASGLGDIGQHFPDTDEKYKNINSILLLKNVNKLLVNKGISIINIDSVIVCDKPKISPYILKMKENISSALDNLDPDKIGIKGKTTEGLGYTGRGEGIAVQSVALIRVG